MMVVETGKSNGENTPAKKYDENHSSIEESAEHSFHSPVAKCEAGPVTQASSTAQPNGNADGENRIHDTDGSIYDRARDPPGQRSVYIPPGNEKQESYRLSTFAKFPLDVPVTPKNLAAAGFYYTGYKDRVKCFSCGLCVENWVVGDDAKHPRWHRSSCDFINGRESGNIPIVGGIFSRFLTGAGANVYEGTRRQPTAPPAPTPVQPAEPEVPMEDERNQNNLNVSSTEQARSVAPPSRFLGRDFDFAQIHSDEHENLLRRLDLNMERNRLNSFDNWPRSSNTVSPGDLARSGFFYLGNLDRVQCFSCGGVLRNWTFGDVVDNEHRRHFAHCKMVRGIEEANNPLTEAERQQPPRERIASTGLPEPPDPDASLMPGLRQMFPCLQPVNPHMQTEARRLETFDHRWPGNIRATTQQIAKAGFFFLGERDRVKCWYCNGGLQNWDPDDEPWSEHAKWFPTCEFILQRKGPDFVHRIVAAFPNLRRPLMQGPFDIPPNEELGPGYANGPARRRPSPPPPIIDPQEEMRKLEEKVVTAMQSEVVRNVLSMGFTENNVRRAVKRKITNTGSSFNDADELLEALNSQEENSDEEEPPQPSSGLQRTSGQTRVNITGGSFIGPNVIGNQLIQPTGSNEPSSSQATSVKQASTTETNTPMEIEPNENISIGSNEEQSASMKQRLQRLQEERMCKVCLDRPADIVFVPCGHLCCCYQCAGALRKCPVCRKRIEKSIRTYMS